MAFIVVSLMLMFCDRHFLLFSSLRESVSLSIAPIQYVITLPGQMVNWLGKNFSSKKEIVNENAKLRNDQLYLQAQLQKLDYLTNENIKLRALLGLADRLNEKVKAAQLFSLSSTSGNMEMLLDKGKKDGVYVGQNILDAYGVMGQIVAVNWNSSRVMLITDPKSAIPVVNARTGMQAIAIGTGSPNVLQLLNLPETADISEGDLLVTSGLGKKFPEGYPVGEIHTVQHVAGERFAKIIVTPKSHITNSKYVLLLYLEDDTKEPAADGIKTKKKGK